MRVSCWFAKHFDAGPCEGRLEKAHVIPKQRIRRELTARGEHLSIPERADLYDVIWDPRVWVWGCQRHHGLFDRRLLRITRADVPAEAEAYAAEHALEWCLDHDYGEREAVA